MRNPHRLLALALLATPLLAQDPQPHNESPASHYRDQIAESHPQPVPPRPSTPTPRRQPAPTPVFYFIHTLASLISRP